MTYSINFYRILQEKLGHTELNDYFKRGVDMYYTYISSWLNFLLLKK